MKCITKKCISNYSIMLVLVSAHPAGGGALDIIVAGILCVLDQTNVRSMQFVTVGASKRLPFEICLISVTYGQL